MSKEAVLYVLEKAASEKKFLAELVEEGEIALDAFDLTGEEAAALLSGDVRWIEKHFGEKLSPRQKIALEAGWGER